MNKEQRAKLFREQGFLIEPGFLASTFTTTYRTKLRAACDAVLERDRAQSEGIGHTTPRISLVEAIPNADIEEILASFVSAPALCALLRDVTSEEVATAPPRLERLDYYHEQTKRDWDGDWHRDSQFGRPDPTAEERVLTGSHAEAPSLHLRVAFERDDHLEIVPGSHARWDTPEELRIRKGAARAASPMPDARRITLAPGDACIFHASTIHRATYRRDPIRRTLDVLYALGAVRPRQFQR